jgi:hypothetical protein
MIELPPKTSDEGLESRVLLAECRGPLQGGFNLADAKLCMQLMDRVLWNRVADPGPYLAHEGTLLAVVRARNQFQGFEHYPHYNSTILKRIQSLIDIANNPPDPRSAGCNTYIQSAIAVARSESIVDPSPGTLAYWRTAGFGAPAAGATKYKTVLGTDFWYVPRQGQSEQ